MTDQDATPNAAVAGTFSLGGDLLINRLADAMRLTGRGILGEPESHKQTRRVLRRAVRLGSSPRSASPDSYGPEVSERLVASAPLSK